MSEIAQAIAFLSNHSKGIWSMDFFTMPTVFFKVLYVLVIVSHECREIKDFAVTQHPSFAWTAQQLREATPFSVREQSKSFGTNYLIVLSHLIKTS